MRATPDVVVSAVIFCIIARRKIVVSVELNSEDSRA